VIGIVSFPWLLYEDANAYIFTWLGGYGSLLAAFAAVMIVDYWFLRRTALDVADLFTPQSQYWYTGGYNIRALVAVAVGVIPVLPGYIHAATTPGGVIEDRDFFDEINRYGIFVAFALAAVTYLALTIAARRAGAPEEAPALAE
jgi:NCS1 family nucleobase:cation symporter-1